MVNFTINGIGLSTQDARLTPKPNLETTTPELTGNTNGKLFVAIKDFDPNTPNAIALIFQGKSVCIEGNEKWIQTNTATQPSSGFKTIPFEVPMRFIDKAQKPATYTIQFLLGTIADEKFIEETKSAVYTLTITSDKLPTGKITTD